MNYSRTLPCINVDSDLMDKGLFIRKNFIEGIGQILEFYPDYRSLLAGATLEYVLKEFVKR
jgi:hypothetical protein